METTSTGNTLNEGNSNSNSISPSPNAEGTSWLPASVLQAIDKEDKEDWEAIAEDFKRSKDFNHDLLSMEEEFKAEVEKRLHRKWQQEDAAYDLLIAQWECERIQEEDDVHHIDAGEGSTDSVIDATTPGSIEALIDPRHQGISYDEARDRMLEALGVKAMVDPFTVAIMWPSGAVSGYAAGRLVKGEKKFIALVGKLPTSKKNYERLSPARKIEQITKGKGVTVYFAPSLYKDPKGPRRADNYKARLAAVAEGDKGTLEAQRQGVDLLRTLGLKVHVVTFSGSKSLHIFIRIPRGTSWKKVVAMEQLMCLAIDGDPAVVGNKAQLMRLAGALRREGDGERKAQHQLLVSTDNGAPQDPDVAIGILERHLQEQGMADWKKEFEARRKKKGTKERIAKVAAASGWGGYFAEAVAEEASSSEGDSGSVGGWLAKHPIEDQKRIVEECVSHTPRREVGEGTYEAALPALIAVANTFGASHDDWILDLFYRHGWPDDDLNSSKLRGIRDRQEGTKRHFGSLVHDVREALGDPSWLPELERLTRLTPSEATAQQHENGNLLYRILGWCEDRQKIFYQRRGVGQISSFKPGAYTELLKLAPLDIWKASFAPPSTENNPDPNPAWPEATSSVIELADQAGVFNLNKLRGPGVWLDNDLPVWHLGDRLEVGGELIQLDRFQGGYYYSREAPLAINPEVEPLSNAEGSAILQVIKDMGWENPADGLHTAGWVVLSNVGGALPKRPGLQITGSTGIGKTDCVDNVLLPLQAGLARSSSGSTEAGVRQMLGNCCLPAIIDESEQEDPRRREQQLRLARYSYDGVEQVKGTPSGAAMRFAVRSSLCLIGINATIPNAADRNRIAVVIRRHLDGAIWKGVARRRADLITRETGERLLRRTVTHLDVLLHNVQVLGQVVVERGGTPREGDTYGALLAGAHLLVSTERLDLASGLEWLVSQSWALDAEVSEVCAAGSEAERCLQHLLSHEVRFGEKMLAPTGVCTVRELIRLVAQGIKKQPLWMQVYQEEALVGSRTQAKQALGRLGLKVDKEKGLIVATGPRSQVDTIFEGTKWVNGAFKERLLDLEGAGKLAGTAKFPVIGVSRGVFVPLEVLGGVVEAEDKGGD